MTNKMNLQLFAAATNTTVAGRPGAGLLWFYQPDFPEHRRLRRVLASELVP